MGSAEAAAKVRGLGNKGTELAAYLVNHHNWKGIYINPDVYHPLDKDNEHAYSSTIAKKQCKYYAMPLQYQVTNYSVTPKSHSSFQKVNPRRGVTSLNKISYTSLSDVRFGFGVFRGGRHSWRHSSGKVLEVHWDSVGDGLYQASQLKNFPWLSGAIVIPPDQASHLVAKAKLVCGG